MVEQGGLSAALGNHLRFTAAWVSKRRIVVDLVLFGLLPPLFMAWVLFVSTPDTGLGWDYRYAYYPAANHVLAGESPFPASGDPSIVNQYAYVYPPLVAYVLAPLTLLGAMSGVVMMIVLITLSLFAAAYLLGVRDWRCYGVLLCWAPVYDALLNGTISGFLPLAVAIAWRWRHRAGVAGWALGAGIAAKLFLVPVLVWPLATRRPRLLAIACMGALALVLVPWSVLGFADIIRYPGILDELTVTAKGRGFSPAPVAIALGAPDAVGRAFGLLLGLGLLAAAVQQGRRGRDARSLTLGIAAALALSPIVWVHYWVLLLVPIALARPRLSPAWAVPILAYPGLWWRSEPIARAAAVAVLVALTAYLIREVGDSAAEVADRPAGTQLSPPETLVTSAASSSA